MARRFGRNQKRAFREAMAKADARADYWSEEYATDTRMLNERYARRERELIDQPAPGAQDRINELEEGLRGLLKVVTKRISVILPEETKARALLNGADRAHPPTDDTRHVLEQAAKAARDALVAMEWPPNDGDAQIDAVMAAIRALIPQPATTAEENIPGRSARRPYSACTNRTRSGIPDGAHIPCCIADKSWCRCDNAAVEHSR